ncbi:serine hydrolase [Anaerosporobacter faecicola]|uniref:serine hydrolase n=1 Tax=Anaerosporobacter faecicola TaxID=2718714 RepID=UPI00143881A3|nr:serine hydrolase [Anaerosporobacter faecicola]
MLNLNNFDNIKVVHITKDNQLIYEYIRENEQGTTVFPVGCIFKSFLSVLVGIALYEGKINSIEDCIIDYVSHDELADINWYKLKIKHALSKTTGIIWPGPQETLPANMNEVMKLKFGSEPGVSFQYKPDPQILVYLLEEIYGLEITELFKLKIISHFTNKDYEWDRDDIQGMKTSVPLLDELGLLFLNKGVIGGKRLFSEEYYEQTICKYSCGGFPKCTAYGLGLWLENDTHTPYFYAAGFGGQVLAVIPQKKMIISILSDMDRPHPENKEIIKMALQNKEL